MITLRFSNVMSAFVGPDGLTDDALQGAIKQMSFLCDRVQSERAQGKVAFTDLAHAERTAAQVEQFAEDRRTHFRNVVHIGIGGSALGAIALQTALKPRFVNLLSVKERDFCPRVFVLDNVDPQETRELLELAEPKETLYHIVTKSGETTETVAAFMLALDRARRALGNGIREHFVVTTGAKGFLRQWAQQEKVPTFDIPEGVGGRFSVFTPVGLLPAAFMGIPLRELLAGALAMDPPCFRNGAQTNVAFMLALIAHLLDSMGKNIHVVMPYSRALRDVADWFRQLWAESLGKKLSRDGRVVQVGPTPVLALGATDQHSQIQLYMEGPKNKFVLFLAPERYRLDATIPSNIAPELTWLEGKKVSEIITAERLGTETSLAAAGRPNATIEIPEVSPRSVGALLYMLQAATVYAGHLYNVNPFDQPGVEQGKRAAFALLGRPGYEQEREKLETATADRERYVVR